MASNIEENGTIYRMRPLTADGKWDTLSHAAAALLAGSGIRITQAEIQKTMEDIAKEPQNSFVRFKVIQTIDPVAKTRVVTVVEMDGFSGDTIKSGGIQFRGKPKKITDDELVTVRAKNPKPGQDLSAPFECPEFEYRHADGKPLAGRDPIHKPSAERYKIFAEPTPQLFKACAECIIEKLPEAVDPEPVVFSDLPKETVEFRDITQDLSPRAKLVQFPDMGTAGNGDIYTVINAPMLFGRMPKQPGIAARGADRANSSIQTVGDAARVAADMLLGGQPFSLNGISAILIPFHLKTPDSSGNVKVSQQGSNVRGGVTNPLDELVVNHNQWAAGSDQLNPFGTSTAEFRDSIVLPGLSLQLDANGNIIHAPGSQYSLNSIYSSNGGVPSFTSSQTEVDSDFKEKNTQTYGAPSAPVALLGTSNYAMAETAYDLSIVPQMNAATVAYDTAIASGNLDAAKIAAQHSIDLLNYSSTLVGISNYTVIADISNITTKEQLENLNPAEMRALVKARLIKEAEKQGITGLDADHLPAESPLRAISKNEMRREYITWYDIMAKNNQSAFARLYAEKEHVGKEMQADLNDEVARKKAVTEFVDAMSFIKNYPGEKELAALDRFISTRDPKDPTNLKKNNFNTIEKGGKKAVDITPAPEMETTAMQIIATDPALTAILLAGATHNRKLAETIALRDRYSIDMPAALNDDSFFNHGTHSRDDVKQRGYSMEVLDSTFGPGQGQSILRGDITAIQRDLMASANDPQVVALRQRDFLGMAKAGTTDAGGAFPKGSLQTSLLYSLSTETDEKTLKALEAEIKKLYPSQAESMINNIHAGLQSARNRENERLTGMSHDARMAYIAKQQVVSAGIAGVNLDSHIDPDTKVSPDDDRAKAMSAHVANEKNIVLAKALLNYQAKHGSEKTSEDILDLAAKLPDAERIMVAKVALKGLEKLQGADRVRAVSELGLDIGKFMALNPNKLTADDAEFVLRALKHNHAEMLAVEAIAQDSKATKAVIAALAKADPKFVQTISNQLDAASAAGFAKMLGVDEADLKNPVQTHTVNTQTIVVIPEQAKIIKDAATRKVAPKPTAEQKAAGVVTPDQRAVEIVTNFFSDPVTSQAALSQLIKTHPDYTSALVLQALGHHPEIIMQVVAGMNVGGFSKFFNATANARLVNILEDISNAQGDEAKLTQATAKLQAFSTDPANAAAMQTMVASIMQTDDGRNAVISSVNTTLDAALAGDANPLPGRDLNARDTLDNFYKAIVKADPANAKFLAALGLTHIDNMPVVHDNWNWPLIIIPLGRKKKPNEPLKNDVKPGCEDKPAGCDLTPPGPGTTPTTPPPQPPAPTTTPPPATTTPTPDSALTPGSTPVCIPGTPGCGTELPVPPPASVVPAPGPVETPPALTPQPAYSPQPVVTPTPPPPTPRPAPTPTPPKPPGVQDPAGGRGPR